MEDKPLTNRTSAPGKDPKTGLFQKGNKCSTGSPHAAKVAKLRAAVMEAVSQKDIKEIIWKMLTEAKSGNVKAAEWISKITGIQVKHIDLNVSEQVKLFDCIDIDKV